MSDLLPACTCRSWVAPLRDWNDVKTRMASSAARELSQALDVDAQGDWVSIYKCRACGQQWAKEYPFGEMHGGGSPCFYAIECDDTKIWLAEKAGLPARLRQEDEDQTFFESLGDERSEPRCAASDCSREAISNSIFCRVHHFESTKGQTCRFA